MCQVSEKIPVTGDEQEFQVIVHGPQVVLRLTDVHGVERDVEVPMRKVAQCPAMRALGAAAGVLLALLVSGCDPIRGGVAVAADDAGAAVEPDAELAAPLPPVTADCRVIMLANVYQPGTDRLTAPLAGVDRQDVVVYLDNAVMERSAWSLADDGHTLVVTHCLGGAHVVSVSIGCTSVGLDCSAAQGCR